MPHGPLGVRGPQFGKRCAIGINLKHIHVALLEGREVLTLIMRTIYNTTESATALFNDATFINNTCIRSCKSINIDIERTRHTQGFRERDTRRLRMTYACKQSDNHAPIVKDRR